MRILIVRLSSLGDVVHAAAVLPDIAHNHPGAHVEWVVEEAFAPLLRSMVGVQRILPIALRRWRRSMGASQPEIAAFWRSLREPTYDVVIDLQGLIKSAAVTRAARLAPSGRRCGLANRTEGSAYEPLARWAYDDAVAMPSRVHVVDRSRRLVAHALGYAVDGAPRVPWVLPALDAQDRPWADPRAVLLVHGSAKASKLLPPDFWAGLGRGLVSAGARVFLPWGNEDERLRAAAIAELIDPSRRPDTAVVLPRLPLDRLAAVIGRCHGSIGLDTGLSHMAATLGRPTVQVFIEDKAWRAGAYWEPRTAVLQASEATPPTVAGTLEAWRRVA